MPNFELTLLKEDQEILKECYKNLEKEENKIRFNCLNLDTTLDLETETFTRENEDYEFFLAIPTKSCTIHLKKENLDFPIAVDYCELNATNNKIILEYSIETEDGKIKMILTRKEDTHE